MELERHGRGGNRRAGRAGRALIAALACVSGVATQMIAAPTARADNLWLKSCAGYGNTAQAFGKIGGRIPSLSLSDECGSGRSLEIVAIDKTVDGGRVAGWYTTSPAGVEIDYAQTWAGTPEVDCALGSDGYEAFWQSSGFQSRIIYEGGCQGTYGLGTGINRSIPGTSTFEWYVWCTRTNGCAGRRPLLGVYAIALGATETSSPDLRAVGGNNLYYQRGRWVRGAGWPISLQGADATGLCNMRAWLDGRLIQGPTAGVDQAVWDQCDPSGAGQQWAGPSATISTNGFANGSSLALVYQGENAAQRWSSSPASTSYVDNAPVSLTLTGPADAPTTAGTQYVTATATAGPSGVGSIQCSVDGSAWSARSISSADSEAASASIPVSGLGSHQVVCYASNRAVDPSGAVATSVPKTWSIKIGEPVIAGISFSRIVRHCRRVRERVRIPAHWVTVRRHHKLVHVRVAAKTRREWVMRCRVHSSAHALKRVAFGRRATVGGWLATANGTAIAGAPVSIMTAANNGLHAWRRVAVVTTSPDGGWSARVPAGPSRLIEAVYSGGQLTQPASSRIVKLSVPARIEVSISPRSVPWTHSITIRGRLLGGYVPRDGVALRLLVRYVGSPEPTDLLGFRTSRTGTFRIRFTFGAGHGVETLPIWVATTATESDYPFAAAASKRMSVTFGR